MQIILDLGNRITMRLESVPAGRFMMGSPNLEKGRSGDEGPRHEVTISKPFYVGIYPVTQQQFQQLMGRNPSVRPGENQPVDSVTWEEAVEFCKKLSLKAGRTVRLPTEAQWEYACRAGTTTRYSYGDDNDYWNLDDYAWTLRNSLSSSQPVGQKKPNAWRLYDMHGNVWEWCLDWYVPSYPEGKATDPAGPPTGCVHVLRGGSWMGDATGCRSAVRYGGMRTTDGSVGFRVVAT